MGALWTLKDAQEQLETVAEAADGGEPQRVMLENGEEIVVLSKRDYELMSARPQTFVEHILSAPKLPADCQDLFDKNEPWLLELAPRDVVFD